MRGAQELAFLRIHIIPSVISGNSWTYELGRVGCDLPPPACAQAPAREDRAEGGRLSLGGRTVRMEDG